jgi:hypothetical protein
MSGVGPPSFFFSILSPIFLFPSPVLSGQQLSRLHHAAAGRLLSSSTTASPPLVLSSPPSSTRSPRATPAFLGSRSSPVVALPLRGASPELEHHQRG